MTPRLRDVVECLDGLYDPGRAAPWDAVGTVCGDPAAEVRRVLLAVDPVAAVAAEAVAWGADLLVTHHPLFLRPVHGIPADTAKGRLVQTLVQHGCGLHTCHTNADEASPGVSDALAAAIGLVDLTVLAAEPEPSGEKLVTFVPEPDVDTVVDALHGAGAGVIGAYERCAWTTPGTGTFRPGASARPVVGEVGRVERVPELRVEMVVPRARRDAAVAALRVAHPYEEPAYDVYALAPRTGRRGIGRVGRLPEPEPLHRFGVRVASALPVTAGGVRVAGEPDRPVETVAVCGGAGDALLGAASSSGADVFVTADLRHHPAAELREEGGDAGMALVDVAHWASEWPWLNDAAARLRAALGESATTVETRVSEIRTDPWTLQVPSGADRGTDDSVRSRL